MRVKISANPPLPAVRAWFPLQGHAASASTISSFKTVLCTSLPAFRGISSTSLRLSIDGYELLDHSELTVVRDGDLISVDVRDVPPETLQSTSHGKRKRRASTPSSPSSESDTESTSESESESGSESESETSDSDSDDLLRKGEVTARPRTRVEHPQSHVPPGHGKARTRARNLRRRQKRMHERDANASGGGPVSGANGVVPIEDAPVDADWDADAPPRLMSLSLRNKNKAKNFKLLMNKPLPAKIIFGDSTTTESVSGEMPRLIPPSSRSSLPANMFVTSVDVERKRKHGDGDAALDIGKLESHAKRDWATLEKPTRLLAQGTFVGYKALGIDAETCTPGEVTTLGRVVSCDEVGVLLRPLRTASFAWTETAMEETEHPWEEIESGDWKMLVP